jgi:hypothetical protein
MFIKEIFKSEVNSEIQKHPMYNERIISEEDIASLPTPVQRYFRYCGIIGKPNIINARIEWKDVFLKMAPDKEWKKIKCYQFNSVPEPVRLAYMKSKIAGIVPFEGRDKYQNGQGNMLIKLLKILTVSDSKGKEMNESALVTVLAEALFIPSYALQPYIKWKQINEISAGATIENNGIKVSGIFYFNEIGENIKFETNDRNYAEKSGSFKKIKWTAMIGNYALLNGIRIPTSLKAIWHLPTGDYEYFKGRILNLIFNIKEFKMNK